MDKKERQEKAEIKQLRESLEESELGFRKLKRDFDKMQQEMQKMKLEFNSVRTALLRRGIR